MNIHEDIINELDRKIYLKKIEFNDILLNMNLSYPKKIKKLIKISKELTILVSQFTTIESLLTNNFPPEKSEEHE